MRSRRRFGPTTRERGEALPDRQREALILCALDGHTNIEAAEIMDVSVEAMESLLARGRRKLKSLMQEQLQETGT